MPRANADATFIEWCRANGERGERVLAELDDDPCITRSLLASDVFLVLWCCADCGRGWHCEVRERTRAVSPADCPRCRGDPSTTTTAAGEDDGDGGFAHAFPEPPPVSPSLARRMAARSNSVDWTNTNTEKDETRAEDRPAAPAFKGVVRQLISEADAELERQPSTRAYSNMAPSPSDRANEKRTILVRRLTKKANEVPCPHCDTREFKYLQSMEKHCWDAHGVRLSREEKETFERRLRAVHAVRAGGAGLGERKKIIRFSPLIAPRLEPAFQTLPLACGTPFLMSPPHPPPRPPPPPPAFFPVGVVDYNFHGGVPPSPSVQVLRQQHVFTATASRQHPTPPYQFLQPSRPLMRQEANMSPKTFFCPRCQKGPWVKTGLVMHEARWCTKKEPPKDRPAALPCGDASAAAVDGLAVKAARDAEKIDSLRDQLVEIMLTSDNLERDFRAKIDELSERANALEARQVANAAAGPEASRPREELGASPRPGPGTGTGTPGTPPLRPNDAAPPTSPTVVPLTRELAKTLTLAQIVEKCNFENPQSARTYMTHVGISECADWKKPAGVIEGHIAGEVASPRETQIGSKNGKVISGSSGAGVGAAGSVKKGKNAPVVVEASPPSLPPKKRKLEPPQTPPPAAAATAATNGSSKKQRLNKHFYMNILPRVAKLNMERVAALEIEVAGWKATATARISDGDGGDGKEILLDRRELNVDVLDIALREANARVRALEMEMTTHAAAATVEKKRSEALRARSETLQRELDRAWALVGRVKVEEKSRRDGEARPE